MGSFYELFVKYSLNQCTSFDYKNKKSIKKHNDASKKLLELKKCILSSGDLSVFFQLLHHPDERVRINAASFCLSSKIYIDEAKAVLDTVQKSTNDKSFQFDANMLLKQYSDA